jgi:hypothetical protein
MKIELIEIEMIERRKDQNYRHHEAMENAQE